MKNTLKEFKDFIATGNLVDVAVAFVLAIAVNGVINSFINGIVLNIIAAVFGEPSFDGLNFTINNAVIAYGAFLTAVVNLLIVGAVLFAVVKAMSAMKKPAEDAPAAPTEIELLTEIRDSLKK